MRTVTIIGGGVAGLCLGIGLRRAGVPARVVEAGHYPRHKVCGEFFSGRGAAALGALELDAVLAAAGARHARDAAFSLGARSLPPFSLPAPALCLSRWRMDAALATHFTQLGGELVTGTRASIEAREGFVRATGRRARAEEGGWRLFGLKAHAHGLTPAAGLEMHFTPRGYVGISAVEDGRTNVCGLFRSREPVPDLAHGWRAWLSGEPGSALHSRLAGAAWDEHSFTCVAGLSLARRSAGADAGIAIGDSVTMIPPVTGNGMSMAVESAVTAVAPLAAWSVGGMSWNAARMSIAAQLDARFSTRLRAAAMLQAALVHRWSRNALWLAARLCPPFQRAAFHLTR